MNHELPADCDPQCSWFPRERNRCRSNILERRKGRSLPDTSGRRRRKRLHDLKVDQFLCLLNLLLRGVRSVELQNVESGKRTDHQNYTRYIKPKMKNPNFWKFNPIIVRFL